MLSSGDVVYYLIILYAVTVVVAAFILLPRRGHALRCGSSSNPSFTLEERAGLKGYSQHGMGRCR